MRHLSRCSAVFAAMALASSGFLAAPSAALAATVNIQPMLYHRFFSATQPPTTAECQADFGIACYVPAQFQTAYDEAPLFSHGITGAGQTIVIVDAFGSPTIQSDLTTFDQSFGLPSPPHFNVIQPAGPVTFDPTNSEDEGWAGETTLDVEWAHTMAPGANILLVETPADETEGTAGFPQIVQAENYVVAHHLGDVISQSFGATEETFPTPQSLLSLRSAYINAQRAGITVLAASGDDGATDATDATGDTLSTTPVTSWPPSDPLVTGVGGTEVDLDANGNRLAPDVAWNDTNNVAVNEGIAGDAGPNAIAGGGGKSVIFPRPSYQNGVIRTVGFQRGVPDISMNGACSALVVTYSSYPGETAGFGLVCGTSEATPLFAGIVSLADQVAHHPLGLINPALYQLSAEHAAGLVDVTSGNNTVSFTQNGEPVTVSGFPAGPGYDLVTGVGTVDAARFVPELAQTASHGFPLLP